jgi:hypothetical protein
MEEHARNHNKQNSLDYQTYERANSMPRYYYDNALPVQQSNRGWYSESDEDFDQTFMIDPTFKRPGKSPIAETQLPPVVKEKPTK